MKKTSFVLLAVALPALLMACDGPPTSDDIQRRQSEQILTEGTLEVGMPAIKNFRERKLMKDILEKRDQEGLVTYTYLFSEMRGCLIMLGNTVGYPLPYGTQFTNPQKVERPMSGVWVTLPQADPNGLFSPASAEASWSLMKDPHGAETGLIYSEPRLISMPFKADEGSLCPK